VKDNTVFSQLYCNQKNMLGLLVIATFVLGVLSDPVNGPLKQYVDRDDGVYSWVLNNVVKGMH
jgi:hypothetical protein